MRINKYIAASGLCSRRKADILVDEGRVTINGSVALKHMHVKDEDIVKVDNDNISQEELIYIMFNKPKGYVTACSDNRNRTIMELIDVKERVFPLGRLDIDSEGLLILTNDGDLFNSIMHPKAKVWKRYYIETNIPLKKACISKLEEGVYVKKFEYRALPSKINSVSGNTFYIEIREGKKREIKRMLSSIGYKVKYLKRVSIGNLELSKDLSLGSYRYLTEKEIAYLKGI